MAYNDPMLDTAQAVEDALNASAFVGTLKARARWSFADFDETLITAADGRIVDVVPTGYVAKKMLSRVLHQYEFEIQVAVREKIDEGDTPRRIDRDACAANVAILKAAYEYLSGLTLTVTGGVEWVDHEGAMEGLLNREALRTHRLFVGFIVLRYKSRSQRTVP